MAVLQRVKIACSPAHHAFHLWMSRLPSNGLTKSARLWTSAVNCLRVAPSITKLRSDRLRHRGKFSLNILAKRSAIFLSFSTKEKTSTSSLRISAKQQESQKLYQNVYLPPHQCGFYYTFQIILSQPAVYKSYK